RLLVVAVLGETLDLLALDRHGALVLLDAVAVEDAHLDDGAGDAGRNPQRSVAHVRGLLAEDGAEELLLRRHRALALRRDLADADQRTLVDAGILVRALELHQTVDVDAGLGGVDLLGRPDDDTGRVDLVDDAGPPGRNGGAGVAGDDRLHAGADERRLGLDQR